MIVGLVEFTQPTTLLAACLTAVSLLGSRWRGFASIMQTRRRSMDAFNDKVRELKEKYLKPAQIDKYLLECQVQMPPSFMPDMPRGRASRRHASLTAFSATSRIVMAAQRLKGTRGRRWKGLLNQTVAIRIEYEERMKLIWEAVRTPLETVLPAGSCSLIMFPLIDWDTDGVTNEVSGEPEPDPTPTADATDRAGDNRLLPPGHEPDATGLTDAPIHRPCSQ